uniref:non-specific serine/threonine protein kinase n=1 Tax=Salix viminalis TaxID=40686 RepID=A0A6N2MX20_SALVM
MTRTTPPDRQKWALPARRRIHMWHKLDPFVLSRIKPKIFSLPFINNSSAFPLASAFTSLPVNDERKRKKEQEKKKKEKESVINLYQAFSEQLARILFRSCACTAASEIFEGSGANGRNTSEDKHGPVKDGASFDNEKTQREQDFGEDESESDDSAGSVEETCSESEVEDDNDAVNEEEWTSSAEAKSDCRDYDAVDLEANAQAALKKLLPCSLEEFEKMIQECLKEETSDDDVIGDRVKYIGPSIRIEADDSSLSLSDDNPPIPDSLSPDITDFLRQCFKKDATQRPDAKTLLSHPWILKSKPALNSFVIFERGDEPVVNYPTAMLSVQEDVSVDTVILNGDKQGTDQNSSVDKTEASVAGFEAVSRKQLLTESDDVSKSCKDNSSNDDEVEERTDKLDNDLHSDQVPTLAIHEKSSLKTSSGRLSMNKVAAACAPLHGSTDMHDQDQALSNGDMESPDAVKTSMNLGGNELSKFSDTPRDASLDDLFHPLDKNPEFGS